MRSKSKDDERVGRLLREFLEYEDIFGLTTDDSGARLTYLTMHGRNYCDAPTLVDVLELALKSVKEQP